MPLLHRPRELTDSHTGTELVAVEQAVPPAPPVNHEISRSAFSYVSVEKRTDTP